VVVVEDAGGVADVDCAVSMAVVEGAGAVAVVEGFDAEPVVGGAAAGGVRVFVVVAVADGLLCASCMATSPTRATRPSVAMAPTARHRRVGEEGMGELPPGGTRRGNFN
jgi:hypothetical protein